MTRTDSRLRRLLLAAGVTVAAAVTGVGAPAQAAPAGQPAADAADGSWIVTLKPGNTPVTVLSQRLAARYGGTVARTYLAAVRGFQLRIGAAGAARLAADPAVASVAPDAVVRLSGVQTAPVWGLDRVDQRTRPLSKSYTSRSAAGVTVYVLDTGVRTSHSEFGGRATSGWDFVDRDATANDCNGHGTHVAGTVGGATFGVAKDVKIVAVRVLDCAGSGSYSTIIAGIDWVTQHAAKPAVVNMSVGGPADSTLNRAVGRSIAAGVTYVVAAGNDNKAACSYSPASAAGAVTVGAVDDTDTRATFSNYGTCVDLFAPGVRITSASSRGDMATQSMSGTSMATPHAAGAAALVLGGNPAWTPGQVRNALLGNATPNLVGSPGAGSANRLLYTGWLNEPAVVVPADSSPTPKKADPPGQVKKTAACAAGVTTALRVPDRAAAVSTRTVTGCSGAVPAAATVDVKLDTAYRGALTLDLVAPDGSVHRLRTARRTEVGAGLTATYPTGAAGVARNGTWRLKVTDAYGAAATLRSWTLHL